MKEQWKEIGALLPKQPDYDAVDNILSSVYEGYLLGNQFLIFERCSVSTEDYKGRTRKRWGARCVCGACGEEFIAGYKKRHGDPVIRMYMSEDGYLYSGYIDEESEVAAGSPANLIEYSERETMLCPECQVEVELIPKRRLRYGRSYQAVEIEVINVDGYTAVMFWLARRSVTGDGEDFVMAIPHRALVIDKAGKLREFYGKLHGGNVLDAEWLPAAQTGDPMQRSYYSWEAVNGRKIGGEFCAKCPPLAGCTGEKTGLEEFMRAGGQWVGAYLHVWKKHPQVENLMKQGFACAVAQAINEKLNTVEQFYQLNDAPQIPWVNWREVQPHKMLGMSKEAFRALRKSNWGGRTAEVWGRYREKFSGADAIAYDTMRKKVGAEGVDKLLDMLEAGWTDMEPQRVVKYLEKQDMLEDGIDTLIDYRKMMQRMEVPETGETLYPKHLLEAHEALVKLWANKCDVAYNGGFTTNFLKLKDLEWSDGDLCIVVPRSEKELVDEGNTLRHCVGTMGQDHCSGRPIFFVRHARRPERSYYTLNINLCGEKPKEIQLHGYGNERHGENKEYRHSIPKKVRDFCDRWEREVLSPWFSEQKRNKKKKQKGAAA